MKKVSGVVVVINSILHGQKAASIACTAIYSFQLCSAKLKYHQCHHNIRIVTQNSPLLFEKLVVVDDDAAIITMSELIIYTCSSAHARPE